MATITKNKLAAQILKAEMLGDIDKVQRLKSELEKLSQASNQGICDQPAKPKASNHANQYDRPHTSYMKRPHTDSNDNLGVRAKKFIGANSWLDQMFAKEKSVTSSDEAKMFIKTANKFSRDDMETKHFSREFDNSEQVLYKNKRDETNTEKSRVEFSEPKERRSCHRCLDRIPNHLVIDKHDHTHIALIDGKPIVPTLSNVIIRSNDHFNSSFVGSSQAHQSEVETIIERLREMWKSHGHRCIIMETYFRIARPRHKELNSCGDHFQVHCIPIKEDLYEKSRMHFKQAIVDSGGEWSLNKKLIKTEGRRIQRYIPKGLAYFWVCFDELTNGFAHVVEDESGFSRNFGFEILSGIHKGFKTSELFETESRSDQFNRCREFKLDYWKINESVD